MIEIKKEKQINHFLNVVYINYLSTLCTFIYLPLLGTNYKPGQRDHLRHSNFGM